MVLNRYRITYLSVSYQQDVLSLNEPIFGVQTEALAIRCRHLWSLSVQGVGQPFWKGVYSLHAPYNTKSRSVGSVGIEAEVVRAGIPCILCDVAWKEP